MIADVALPPHGSVRDPRYSYAVPADLREALVVGQLVWVPLRDRLVQGVVVRLHDEESGRTLRDIHALADEHAQLAPHALPLAEWLAGTYYIPLFAALSLMLPPGSMRPGDTIWRITTTGRTINLGSLPTPERAVLYYLRRTDQTTAADLQRTVDLSAARLRDVCKLLQQQGLIERSLAIARPPTQPRIEREVRLLVAPTALDATYATLQRAPRQRVVLEWLAAQPAQPVAAGAVCRATGATYATLRALVARGYLAYEERETLRSPLHNTSIPPDNPPPLTAGQRAVWEPLAAALHAPPPDGAAFLLHGVTGSGKTEIYLRAVARVLRQGKQAVVLVPEIALTTQLVRRFAARFPGQVAVLHSSLSPGERYDEWRRVRSGAATVAIGSRSAVFAPLAKPGLVIVDEEHEPGFKHDRQPRYHARDVARQLAPLTGAVVVLGSATPSLESYHAAETGHLTLLRMPERVGTQRGNDGLPRTVPLPLPHVRIVDMRHELQQDNRSVFSHALQAAIATTLERDEQVILFLNRRGAATFVLCRDCGHVMRCPRCAGSLVVHHQPDEQGTPATLQCHACNHHEIQPAFCPACLSPRLKAFGAGTQKVEAEVRRLFPQARPMRWDQDSVQGKGAHDRMLDSLLQGTANVLIGTQMIAKGLDLPRVTLVGVIAADTALYLPDFRSGERTFQLLTQVAGRAGRRTAGAQVIIQTYTPEHYALRAAREHDYAAFFREEIAFRRRTHYPPFSRMVRFIFAHPSQLACEQAATELGEQLHALAATSYPDLQTWGIIGPAPAFFQRVRGRWRWHLLLRCPDPAPILHALEYLPGWTIDIDPVHVL